MPLQFSKLCVRKEPERGCLAKITSSAPKGSSPILHLPSEVRACIFNYIIDEVNLIYQFSPDLTRSKCLASWPEYKKRLSFLKVCKLFEAEALSLIQVKSVIFEIEKPISRVSKIHRLLNNNNNNNNKITLPASPSTIWNVGPQEVPLPLCRIRQHLREIRLDHTSLVALLETNIISTLPKLEAIRVQHKLTRDPRNSEFRDKLEQPSQRNELLSQSHGALYACKPGRFDIDWAEREHAHGHNIPKHRKLLLSVILERARLVTKLPIFVDVVVEFNQQDPDQRIEPVYPVIRNVSEIKFVYEWPKKNLISMEVEVWSQPMAMAFKSKNVEKIALTAAELNGGEEPMIVTDDDLVF